MVVFGGQEDAPLSDVSTCFSNHIYVYHLTCNYWSDMPFPISHNESSHARYAHSMVVRDNLIYVLGGFTGISRSDFLVFAHDRCSWITSSASCTAVAYCSWSPGKTKETKKKRNYSLSTRFSFFFLFCFARCVGLYRGCFCDPTPRNRPDGQHDHTAAGKLVLLRLCRGLHAE